ncbi:hypothetical protein E4T56_gene18781 [Termitomyces sp. T112]|nr:hypothetical protein E4T56_gene18781 [Termitomyces sp. T112]
MTSKCIYNLRTYWMACLIILVVMLGLATVDLSWLYARSSQFPRTYDQIHYSYVGLDYPQTWILPPLESVHLSLENTAHYAFGTDLGAAEWNTTLPTGGAVVYLGPAGRPFTVGMFHRLRCITILQEVLAKFYADASISAQIDRPELAQHCMNYLRQMTLCSADLRLESLRASHGNQLTVPYVTHTCTDWRAVYEAAERNYRHYMDLKEGKEKKLL